MDYNNSMCHAVRHVGTHMPGILALEKLKEEGHWQQKVSSQENSVSKQNSPNENVGDLYEV